MKLICVFMLAGALFDALAAESPVFRLPTTNRALLEPGGNARYFAGTPGRTWEAGSYGCVRSEGHQLHEGVDIRCVGRDARGEPTDAVMATADGVVVYANRRASLSNYGNYVVVQHLADGMDVFSLYAHLAEVRSDLKAGSRVRAGDKLGVMGRTSNTQSRISKERAHLHFELALRISDRFAQWRREREPDKRNDHGEWNGQNLIGLDVARLLREQNRPGANFSLRQFIRNQTELCRVQVRAARFPWLKRYPMLVAANPRAVQQGVAGYELRLNYAGLPFLSAPCTASEVMGRGRFTLVSVNEREQAVRPCGKLVMKRGGDWVLTQNGERLLDLLTY